MDEESFYSYLKQGGRSDSAAVRCVRYVSIFEQFLHDEFSKGLTEANDEDIESFVLSTDRQSKPRTKTYLWALAYYFDFISRDDLKRYAQSLREQRIVRKPFPLSGFLGVSKRSIEVLRNLGIENIEDMLNHGATRKDRARLAKDTGIPESAILDLVCLSDLARIPGIKGIRARLYVDAGVNSVDSLAASDPEVLREELIDFVRETHFDGTAPLPAELRFSVQTAAALPKIVEI